MKKLFTTIGVVLVSALLIVFLKKGTSVKVVSNDKEQLNLNSDIASIETSIDKEETEEYEKISEKLEDEIRKSRNEFKEYEKISEKLEDQIKKSRNEFKEYEKVSKGLEDQIKKSR